PVLGKGSISADLFRAKFHAYLRQFNNPEIIADWHEDIAHFCRQLNGKDFGTSLMFPCRFRLISTFGVDIKPKIPHNSLSDAEALMEWFGSEKSYVENGLYAV